MTQLATAAQEPEQGAWGDVLRDSRAPRTPLIGRRGGESRGLHHVEIIEQTDPHHAGQDMQPAIEARAMKSGGVGHPVGKPDAEDDGEHHAGRDGALDGVERMH